MLYLPVNKINVPRKCVLMLSCISARGAYVHHGDLSNTRKHRNSSIFPEAGWGKGVGRKEEMEEVPFILEHSLKCLRAIP